jgi:AraC-like DNA-binding protein
LKESNPKILSVATSLPPYRIGQEEVKEFARALFSGTFKDIERLAPIFDNVQVGNRYFCVPREWFEHDHGFPERNDLYVEHALDLLCLQLLRAHSSLGDPSLQMQRGLARWQVKRVTDYMREHIGAEINLQDLANLVGMSRFHFCSAFRQATGSTPHACLVRMRMRKACRLLADDTLQIKDVALAVVEPGERIAMARARVHES